MSEVQSRSSVPRGRGSARGGRGGFSSRGGRGVRGHATNGDKADTATSSSIEDDGEVSQLKKQYGSKVGTIKEMFPGWTDEDVVFALQETHGDLEATVERITDGSLTQWGEVSKTKKDRSKSKVKEATTTISGDSANQARVSRGGRAGAESGRGGRSRGADRGRGASRGRGGSAAHTNGSRKENAEVSVPTSDSNAWDNAPTASETAPVKKSAKSADDSWGTPATGTTTTTAQAASSIIPEGVKKSWASMFAPAPVPKKAPEPVVEKPTEPVKQEKPADPPSKEPEATIPQPPPVEPVEIPPSQDKSEPEIIPPSKDELTETNLEQVLDTSGPAPTATAASTAASSWDPRNTSTSTTPYSALQQSNQPQAIRPPTSGFQASALKATGPTGRSASHQRRVLDQEEAVRMPGNREVDRAAVQFGAFNLNGTGDEDVDGDREDAETRAQPPQHSPVAPRAALPPAPQQATAPATEALPTPKQAAGFPAATHPPAAPGLPSPATLPNTSAATGSAPQGNQFGHYGRYGQGQESSALPQKSYDAFNQQAPTTQSPFEGYTNQQSQSNPPQPPSGGLSSAPGEFSSYYTADAQRQAYNNYLQQPYGVQASQGQQDGPSSQQRAFSGYNNSGPQTAEGSSPFPQSAAQQAPSRYPTAGEGQNSGHTTPNPVAQGPQPSQSAQPQQPNHPQHPQLGNNPYSHPYYSSPYYAAYMNNQYQPYGGNYPGPYGKGGLHQQPYQGYAMSPAAPYDHASSPAGPFSGTSSLHGRDSALSGGLGDYGRGGSAQSSQAPQGLSGSGAFSGSHDNFGRNSYQGQNQYSAQQGNQQGSTDDLKPFGDSKTANGPSPSLSQAGRPGSATNTASGSTLPPPQSQQGGYGGYPAHLQQGLHANQTGSQYGGLAGAGGHQQAGAQGHQSSQYGYGGFGGPYSGAYGNNQQRGGWGGNYGH